MTQIQTAQAHYPALASGDTGTKITINPQNASTDFFGKDGADFGDLVDAINPLNHIPLISDLMGDGSAQSTASKLLGGAIFGGPIGFAAALINEIFTEATGKGVAGTMVAALSGDTPAETQIAALDPETDTAIPEQQLAMADMQGNIAASNVVDQTSARPAEIAGVQNATQSSDAARYAEIAQRAKLGILPDTTGNRDENDKAILSLFGTSNPSAHRSYNNAKLLPYLQQVNSSQVL